MSLQLAAKHLAAQGRGPDTTLVHMTPGEVAGLQAIARAHGGTLTINPQTGLPEAGFLSSILPAIAGAFLTPILGPWAPLLIGGAAAIATGSLEKGLMAGIGAYGGAGLADALTKTGTGALSSAAASEALPAAATGAMDTAVAQGSGLASAPSSVLSQVKNVAEAAGTQAGLPVVSPVASAPDLSSVLADQAGAFHSTSVMPPAGATPSAYYGPGQGMEAATVGAPQGVTPPTAPIAPTVTPTTPLTTQAKSIGDAYAQEQAAQNAVANRLGAATPMDKMKAGLSAVMDKPSMLFNKGNMSNIAMAAAPIMFGGGKMKAVPTPSGNIQYYDFDNTTNQWTYRGSVPADEVNKAGGYEAGRALIGGKARGGLAAAFAAGGMARYADGGTTDTAQRNAQIRYQIGQLKDQDALDEWLQLTAFTPEQIAAAMPEYGPAKNWAAARDDAYVRWRGADSPLDAATIAELDKYARAELSGMQALRLTGGFDPQAYYEKLYSDPEAAKAYLARKTAPVDLKGPVIGGYHTIDGGYVTPTVPTWPAPTPAPAPGAPTPPPGTPAPAPYVPYTPPPFTAPPPNMPPAPPPGQSVDGFTTPGMGRISPDMYQGRSGVTGPVNWITDAYEDFWAGAPVGSTMNWAGGTLKRTGGAEAIYTAPDGTTTTLAPKSDLNIIAANNPRIGELWRHEFGLIPQNYMTGSSASAYQYLMGQGKYPVNPKGPVQDEYAAVAMGLPRTGKYIPDYTTGAMVPNPNYVEPKLPTSDNKGVIGNVVDAVTDGNIQFANGGISAAYAARGGMQSHLGDYSDGGRLLRGPGDGVSDSIPATIANKRPARLADGEFVVPARVVSELGNGSTEAGARKLYQMMDRVQKRRGKTVGKGKVAVDSKSDKYLPA